MKKNSLCSQALAATSTITQYTMLLPTYKKQKKKMLLPTYKYLSTVHIRQGVFIVLVDQALGSVLESS